MERRKSIEENLRELGLEYTMIEAVDGKAISPSELLKVYSKKKSMKWTGRELNLGEIGCTLSHLKVYKQIVSEDIPEALVLEDDILLGVAFKKILDNLHLLPNDREFVNFNSTDAILPPEKPFFDIYSTAKFERRCFPASAYLIKNSAAKKLLSLGDIAYVPADHLTGRPDISDLVRYGIVPHPVALRPFESEIDSTGNRHKTEQSKIRKLRTFKYKLKMNILAMLGDRSID